MFSLGIDSGSTMTKGVLFDGINVVGCHMLPTSMRPGQILRDIYDRLYTEETGFVVSTGYGRELLKEADAKITEITCHGAGASYLALVVILSLISGDRTARSLPLTAMGR